MDGLIVKEPFATQLVKGEKDIEYRSTSLPENKRLIDVFILNKGRVLGTVMFDNTFSDDKYEWSVVKHKQFSPYMKYKHKNGCIIWINDVEISE